MEVKIIRTQVVVVADREENQYGDTIFHDMEGNEYKLGNKRAHLSDQIVVGRATELGWAHFNNDYIATAKLVEGELPEATKPPGGERTESGKPNHKPSGEERGMWLKELGSMLRCGDIDKTTAHGKLLRHFYYAAMFNVLDIEIKEEEVK